MGIGYVPNVFATRGGRLPLRDFDADWAYVSGKMVTVKDFGAAGDGATDDTAAIQAAITAVGAAGGGVVWMPPGGYLVSSTINLNVAGVRLMGAGTNATFIITNQATGNIIKLGAAVRFVGAMISGIQFLSSGVRTGGWAVVVDGVEDYILDDLRFGTTGGNALQFSATGASSIGFMSRLDIEILGAYTGVQILNGIDHYFSNCWFRGNSTAGSIGIDLVNCGGDHFVSVESVQFDYGVQAAPGNAQVVNFCSFTDVLADSCVTRGWSLAKSGTGQINGLTLTNCWAGSNGLATANGRGFLLFNPTGIVMTGCRAVNNGGFGFEIDAGAADVTINGGYATGNGQFAPNTYDGIVVAANYTGGLIISNVIARPTANQLNKQRYGIAVLAGTGDNYAIFGNSVSGNLTGGLSDLGTGLNKYVPAGSNF